MGSPRNGAKVHGKIALYLLQGVTLSRVGEALLGKPNIFQIFERVGNGPLQQGCFGRMGSGAERFQPGNKCSQKTAVLDTLT